MKTNSSTKSDKLANTGVIVGITVATLSLIALTIVALYINSHPTAAARLYLLQVSAECVPHLPRKGEKMCFDLSHVFAFPVATQEFMAFLEVSEAAACLLRSGRSS